MDQLTRSGSHRAGIVQFAEGVDLTHWLMIRANGIGYLPLFVESAPLMTAGAFGLLGWHVVGCANWSTAL